MEEKRGFFKDIWTSIKDFEKYEEFAADKLTAALKYMLLLTIIFAAIITLMYTYKFYIIAKDVKTYIEQNIEELSLEERKINCSNRRANSNRTRK